MTNMRTSYAEMLKDGVKRIRQTVDGGTDSKNGRHCAWTTIVDGKMDGTRFCEREKGERQSHRDERMDREMDRDTNGQGYGRIERRMDE